MPVESDQDRRDGHAPLRIEMRGISKQFGAQQALNAVDFELVAGEIHGLLGENGAGKSTLMNVLAGMVRPDDGSINVGGHRLRMGSPADSAALGIGMVHQHFSLAPALTVAENLSLAAGSGPSLYRRSADLVGPGLAVAERLGWRFDPDTPVWQLSIGRQQRLEIVKVLQRDARWLLFDEPTAVLSPPEVEELFAVMTALREEGRSLVFISHKLGEVQRLCDRITILRRGRRVANVSGDATAELLAQHMVGQASVRGRRTAAVALGVSKGQASPTPDAHHLPQHSRQPPSLSVRGLEVRDDRGYLAVRGLSFDVGAGELFGIAGVDGNGQAELAEAIMGLRRVEAGQIEMGGRSAMSGRAARASGGRRPGYIPQDRRRAGVIGSMSVRENLALEIQDAPPFRWGSMSRLASLWEATRVMAERFDIRGSSLRLPAAALSGGNQQKVVIARALTGERSLLVAVNPTRGLDVAATGYVHEQLRAARASGVGILLISTELDEVLDLSDRVGVLYEGRFQAIVLPSEPRERIGQMMGGLTVDVSS